MLVTGPPKKDRPSGCSLGTSITWGGSWYGSASTTCERIGIASSRISTSNAVETARATGPARRTSRPSSTETTAATASTVIVTPVFEMRGRAGWRNDHSNVPATASAATSRYARPTHQIGASSCPMRRSGSPTRRRSARQSRRPSCAGSGGGAGSRPAEARSSAANSSGGPRRAAIGPSPSPAASSSAACSSPSRSSRSSGARSAERGPHGREVGLQLGREARRRRHAVTSASVCSRRDRAPAKSRHVERASTSWSRPRSVMP